MRKLHLTRPPETSRLELHHSTEEVDDGKNLPSYLRFSQVYDLISDGIKIIDTDHNILYMNRAFQVLAVDRARVSFGTKCFDAFATSKCKSVDCPLRCIQSGEKSVQYKVFKKVSGGGLICGALKSRPIWGAKRKLVGMISSFQDTTEVTVARQALESAQRLMKDGTLMLEKKSIALNEVLHQVEDYKKQVALRIQVNLDRSVLPLIHKLALNLGPAERLQLDEIGKSLKNIMSPFVDNLTKQFAALSPREVEICNLIRNGLSSKEIADLISVTEQTVFKQRRNIRKKLRIADGETNLSTYLQSI